MLLLYHCRGWSLSVKLDVHTAPECAAATAASAYDLMQTAWRALQVPGKGAACCLIWPLTEFALPMHVPQPACQWTPCRLGTGQVQVMQAALATHTQEAPLMLHHLKSALQAGDGLIVPLDERRIGRPTSSAAVAAQWFAQDLFAGADVEDEEPTAVGVPAAAATPGSQQRKTAAGESVRKARKLQQAPGAAAGPARGAADQQVAGAAAGPARGAADQQVAGATVRAAPRSKAATAAQQQQPAAGAEADSEDEGAADVLQQLPAEAEPAGFVEVPLAGTEDSDASSEDEYGNLDDNGKAEVLALAKKMLGGRIKNVSALPVPCILSGPAEEGCLWSEGCTLCDGARALSCGLRRASSGVLQLVADLLPVGPELLKQRSSHHHQVNGIGRFGQRLCAMCELKAIDRCIAGVCRCHYDD